MQKVLSYLKIVLPGGDVKAVIEYKQPAESAGAGKIDKATKQMLAMTKEICRLLVVASGEKAFLDQCPERRPILDEKGNELKRVFDIKPIIEGKLTHEQ